MPQIITRLFDSHEQAQHAAAELERVGVARSDIRLISRQSHSDAARADTLAEILIQAGVDHEEAQLYAEGVSHGGTLVRATVGDDTLATALATLDTLPFIGLGVRHETYHVSGSHDAAPPHSAQDIAHDRAR